MQKLRVGINKLTPGMLLAENIVNEKGVTMMPQGVRLTPMFIRRLEKWGVTTVSVAVERKSEEPGKESPRAPAQPDPAEAAKDTTSEQEAFIMSVVAEVGTWFANVRDNPLMMQLRTVAIKKLIADGPEGKLYQFRQMPAPDGGAVDGD